MRRPQAGLLEDLRPINEGNGVIADHHNGVVLPMRRFVIPHLIEPLDIFRKRSRWNGNLPNFICADSDGRVVAQDNSTGGSLDSFARLISLLKS